MTKIINKISLNISILSSAYFITDTGDIARTQKATEINDTGSNVLPI
jgi:hypothetical protein